ncbi:hypothetical protein FF38_12088 [Lucilia cuprina]|uniref:Coilin N-terminal domain-containing protein n=1 Tax=Lucilia cuprina TaxID=7375 RepID=A0A0L0BS10_LUCCU|nr:hypothetical protein FF38_12088 [Lucilia cuprina]
MNKKAIRIDLSTFFDDERRMTCVLVDPNWKSVECLQKRVEFLFDVDSVRFLSDGYFLPPQESIEIIKFCNDLKAFVPKESLEKRKKKKSKKSKNEKSAEESVNDEENITTQAEERQESIDDSQMKRKYNSLSNSCHSSSTLSNKAKRSKNSYNFSEITSTSEQLPTPPMVFDEDDANKNKKSKAKKSKVSLVSTDNFAVEQPILENQLCISKSVRETSSNLEENTLIEISSDNGNKKRHTSTPKDKKTCDFEENTEEKTFNDEAKATAARPSSIPSSTFLNESKMLQQKTDVNTLTNSPNPNNPFKKPKTSKAHIYFNESGEIVNPKAPRASKLTPKKSQEPKTIVIFRCPLDDVTNATKPQKPRIFHLKSTNMVDDNNKKQLVEIQEEIILSPINITNAIIEKPSTEEKSIVNEVETPLETIETSKIEEEVDSLNEKSSLNNTSNATGSTTIAKNIVGEQSIDELEVSRNESTSVTQSQTVSLMQETNVNESSIMSVDCVDLSIDLDEDDSETHKKKITVEKFQNINASEKHDLNVDDDLSSDVEEVSEIIDLNETEDNCDNTANISRVPGNAINDIKVPYTNKKQQQLHTNYLAGKVEYINRRTKSIKLFIIDGNKELSYIPNQFFCNLDDSQDCTKYVQLKLNDMFEPKLFSMS